ncbi:MAG TPA: HAMP domain-containing sensor histidine kinase [Gaiellaceae bacterium]|nr:HAMP domain-containing sensor histidine kinase [Gaiellaceae bacterium]
MRARRFLPLRKLLFLATVLIVIASIGIAFGVGAVLTRSAVENANLDGLARQAQLIKNQQEAGLCAFCRLKDVRAFLAEQHELIRVVDLDRNTPYLTDSQRLELASKPLVTGTVEVEGKRYLVAAGTIKGGRRPGLGFVLLRPSSLKTAGWGPYLRALLIAGAIGAGLAALGSLIIARWISRPVRRVAEASRSLAEGLSPEPVPLEGSAELATLASTFNAMAEQLQRAREAERNFLLSVSHELKTPLAAIRGYAEGLEEGVFGAEEAAATIREEARRLERLVRDLLDLARMNRREFVVHREPVDLAEIAREVVRRYEADARAAAVELDADAAGPAPALADPDRALQIVSNLVENALRSTPAGGSVRVGASPGLLVVEDTGVGLSADDLPHAFERFYLHDRNPDGRSRIGSGLGLAIVKELTERMDGTVSVESELGRGTTFRVRLPTGGPGGGAAQPAATAPSSAKR